MGLNLNILYIYIYIYVFFYNELADLAQIRSRKIG